MMPACQVQHCLRSRKQQHVRVAGSQQLWRGGLFRAFSSRSRSHRATRTLSETLRASASVEDGFALPCSMSRAARLGATSSTSLRWSTGSFSSTRCAEATGVDADDINFCSKTTSGGLGSGMRACGCQLWAASVVLIQFLCAQPETVRGRRVLELGSGSGLTGLVTRVLLGAAKVVLSDSNPHVLKLLRHNCELNCEANPRMARNSLQVASLDWASKTEARELLHAHAADARGDGFDVILASDTVYEPSSTRHVWRCVGDMLSHEPGACFVCAYELRLCFKDLFSNFQAEAKRAGFIAEEIDITSFLEVDDFQINTDEVCHPVEPSSGDWSTLRLYIFRRLPGF